MKEILSKYLQATESLGIVMELTMQSPGLTFLQKYTQKAEERQKNVPAIASIAILMQYANENVYICMLYFFIIIKTLIICPKSGNKATI